MYFVQMLIGMYLTIYSDIPSRDVAGFNVRSGSDVWRDDCKWNTNKTFSFTLYLPCRIMITKYSHC